MQNIVLTFYITARCNLSCSYCYESRSHIPPDMTIDLIRANLKSYLKCKYPPKVIVIFGGEPTLKWDVCSYFFSVREEYPVLKNSRIILFTNGTLLDHKQWLLLMNSNIEVFLSFDGFDNKSSLRYGKSLFYYIKRINSGLNILKKSPNLVTVVFTVGSHNIHSIYDDMRKLFHAFGFYKYKVNILRNNLFSANSIELQLIREKIINWTKSSSFMTLDWDSPDTYGSEFENWYFSSENIRIQKKGELGKWKNVSW